MDQEEIILTSPVPQKKDKESLLTFIGAMKQIMDGKSVTKKEWNNPNIYCTMKEGRLMIYIADEFKFWNITDGDMAGDDWVVLETVNS